MKIEDYCAQKAYAIYKKNFLKSNKDNLTEFEKLNFQKQNDFIPQFTIDLRKKLTTFLDNFPEDRATVRKSLTQILKNNFDNLQENNIVDSSGKINVEAITANLNEGIKKSLPEIYEKAQVAQQVTTQNITQNETGNSLKENVDLSNPKERENYFNGLFNEYSRLKTFDDKLKFFNENFYDISKLEKAEQKTILNAYETGKLIDKKESEYLSTGFSESDAHEKAIEDIAEETGKSKQNIENSYQLKYIIEEKTTYYKELDQSNLSENKRKRIEENILNLNLQEQNLRKELGENNQEVIINEEEQSDNLLEIEQIPNNEINGLFEELNPETLDMNDIFGNIIEETQPQNEPTPEFAENIDHLFDTTNDEAFDMSNLFGDTEQTQEFDTTLESPTNTHINPIVSGVELSDENLQTDYIYEIKQNPLQKFLSNIRTRFLNNTKQLNEGQTNKIKFQKTDKQSLFSKIQKTISKFVVRNQFLTIDTAENNTKTTYEEIKSNFDNSLFVSEEELAKNKAIYEATKKAHKGKSSTINIDDRTST